MPYPYQKNNTGNFFLEGDIRLAQMVLFIMGGLPFVFVCALTTFKVALSAKLLLLFMVNLCFFAGLASLLGLVRHKESNRPVISLIFSILGLLLFWGAVSYTLYLFISL